MEVFIIDWIASNDFGFSVYIKMMDMYEYSCCFSNQMSQQNWAKEIMSYKDVIFVF